MAPPATITLFNIVRDTAGVGIANATVRIILDYNAATVTATGDSIDEVQQTTATDPSGRWAFTIVCNDLLSPANTTYTVIEPHRSYQVAPQSANGASQQATAGNVIVNVPTALAPSTSSITGNLSISGTLGVTGLISANGGLTVTGTLTIPAGGFSMAGPLTLTAAASRIVPGATSFAVRDTANANDNLLVSNAGALTVRAGLTVTAGGLVVTAGNITATASNLNLGGGAITSGAINSQTLSAAASLTGSLTVANGLTLTAGNAIITAGDLTLTAGELIFADAVSQIIPGATSLALTNNANSANNLLLTDAGLATLRNAISVPPVAAGTVAPTSYGSLPVKIDDQLFGGSAAIVTFNNIPTGFRHLVVEWYARTDVAATGDTINMRLNNDSAANYDYQYVRGVGAVASAAETLGATSIVLGSITGNTATAAYFSSGRVQIFHYAGTTGEKPVVANGAQFIGNGAGSAVSSQYVGKWRTVATAVTRVDLIPATGPNFIAGSLFTLWGYP